MNSTITIADESSLRELVQRYKICWDVWPESVVNNSHIEKTGYELELLGTHAEGTHHISPGCGACVEVYNALHQIADYILPKDQGLPTRYEIEPFEAALRYSNTRNNRPDVVLDLKILHRSGFGPIDKCENLCLQLMQDKLNSLGAYRGRWAPDPQWKQKREDHAKAH